MYVVILNRPGYLPEADPQEYATLQDAKQGLRWEVLNYTEYADYGPDARFDVWTPLRSITRAALLKSGEITYGEFSDGYRLNIAIVQS